MYVLRKHHLLTKVIIFTTVYTDYYAKNINKHVYTLKQHFFCTLRFRYIVIIFSHKQCNLYLMTS